MDARAAAIHFSSPQFTKVTVATICSYLLGVSAESLKREPMLRCARNLLMGILLLLVRSITPHAFGILPTTDFVTTVTTTMLLVSNKSACQRSDSIEILYYTRGCFLS